MLKKDMYQLLGLLLIINVFIDLRVFYFFAGSAAGFVLSVIFSNIILGVLFALIISELPDKPDEFDHE